MKRHSDQFEEDVQMWVFEEQVYLPLSCTFLLYANRTPIESQVDGRNLTEIINEKHENVKYVKVRVVRVRS